MPAWISIYCAHPIGEVTSKMLLDGIRDADYWTLAEVYEVDGNLVDWAIKLLHLEATEEGFQLRYQQEGNRQLAIHCWTSPERVKEEIGEAIEFSERGTIGNAKQVRDHMPQVQAVIGIELGFSQLDDMGVVFADEVARWFGQHRSGVIRGVDDNWYRIHEGTFTPL